MKPTLNREIEYLQLDAGQKLDAVKLYQEICARIDVGNDGALLLHFCFQIARILPGSKSLRKLFSHDLSSIAYQICAQRSHSQKDLRNFQKIYMEYTQRIEVAEKVVQQILDGGFQPKGPIKKLLSELQKRKQSTEEMLSKTKRKGPSADVHETEGIWDAVVLFETFLKLSRPYKIKVFNPDGLETNSEANKKVHGVTAMRLTMNFLSAFSLNRTEQVIRKRHSMFEKEMQHPSNPLCPSDVYPDSVRFILKKEKKWVNRWT